jgi:hypothetical protein
MLARDTNQFLIQTRNSTGVFISNDYLVPADASGATNHVWSIAGTEKARIDSSGRLLVGTSSARTFNVGTGTAQPSFQVESATGLSLLRSQDVTTGSQLTLAQARGSAGSPTIINTNDINGLINFTGFDGTNFVTSAWIRAEVDGTPGTGDMPGRLVFSTTADGNASPTERLRITSAGNVGIGTTSPAALLSVSASSATGLGSRLNIENTESSSTIDIVTTGGTFNPTGRKINVVCLLSEPSAYVAET